MVKDLQALLCVANLLLYETTNLDVGYMFGVPVFFVKYTKAFAATDTLIVNGPRVVQCRRCNYVEHSFLEAKGVSLCIECKSSLCCFCVWVEDVTESVNSCQKNTLHGLQAETSLHNRRRAAIY